MKEEDNYGQADMPIAIIPRDDSITMLQMDGHLTKEEFETALKMAISGCKKIYEVQRKALIEAQSS